jgi:type III pantothenate kinase
VLLAIDIGNTNIVLGVFDDDQLRWSWRLMTQRERTADELGIFVAELFTHAGIDRTRVSGIVLSSVVPPLTRPAMQMCRRYWNLDPLVVDPATNTGMPVRYEPVSDVGADRVVNAVAAFELYGKPRQSHVIAIDFGTGTTFDAITKEGEYAGGVICPGIQISADALFQRAARLPRVDVSRPPSVIGHTTVTSIQAGLYYGYVSLVDGVVARMRAELGEPTAVCIATGGLAEVIAKDTSSIEEVNADLTLLGLKIIWERNRSARA